MKETRESELNPSTDTVGLTSAKSVIVPLEPLSCMLSRITQRSSKLHQLVHRRVSLAINVAERHPVLVPEVFQRADDLLPVRRDVRIQISREVFTQQIQHKLLTLGLRQTRPRFLQTLNKPLLQPPQLAPRGGQTLLNLLVRLQLRFNLRDAPLDRRNLRLQRLQLRFECRRVFAPTARGGNRAFHARPPAERLDARRRRLDRVFQLLQLVRQLFSVILRRLFPFAFRTLAARVAVAATLKLPLLGFQFRVQSLRAVQLVKVFGHERPDQLVRERVVAAAALRLFVVLVLIRLQRRADRGHPTANQAAEALRDQALQIVLVLVPPAHDHAVNLVSVEQSERRDGLIERTQELIAHVHQAAAARQLRELRLVLPPPVERRTVEQRLFRADVLVRLQRRLNVAPVVELRMKIKVGVARTFAHAGLPARDEDVQRLEAVRREQLPLTLYLAPRHSARDVRANVVRLRRRGVVRVAPDVAVVIFLRYLRACDDARVAVHVLEPVIGRGYLLNVFGPQVILRAPLRVLGVGVDEENLTATPPRLARRVEQPRAHHQNARRDARPVEQVRRQADDRLKLVRVNEALANLLLVAAAEQNAVRHHRRHPPAGNQHREHVLREHQVALLPLRRGEAVPEAPVVLHVLPGITLAEGRVANHVIEAD